MIQAADDRRADTAATLRGARHEIDGEVGYDGGRQMGY